MKKIMILFIAVLINSLSAFSQATEGDIAVMQKYFGAEKAALLKDYMKFTPEQDSAFWGVYNAYETERLANYKQRGKMIEEYLKSVQNLTEANATTLVDKSIALDIAFKNIEKKYFSKISKAIGPVKAAQWFQFENYIFTTVNIHVMEAIPFVGDLEQKHSNKTKK